jgi:transcriptional regulator with XRE-family HTH domain
MTQKQLAEAIKYIDSPPQPGHISEFELGKREPSLLYLLAVVRLADLPMEVLVDDEIDLPENLSAVPKMRVFQVRAKSTVGKKKEGEKSGRKR